MKKQKKIFITFILLFFILILLINQKVFANTNLIQKVEYSEDFKKWLELSDEEKKNTIQPRMYDVLPTATPSKNLFYKIRLVGASVNSTYSLKEAIPSNLAIRNQMRTNSCWTFAALSSLETNLALYDYKKGDNISEQRVYDFSERHMEYATSKTFKDDVLNPIGYNREVGSGGNWNIAQSYLTNGTGAINESEMPFENNELPIDISQIQNKTVTSQIYDTVEFPDYNKNTEQKSEIMDQIKQHIKNYGSVYASIHGNSANAEVLCYNNKTGAIYCNDEKTHTLDHAVSIIGWDDNYSKENFSEGSRPNTNGAWIIRNSWGEEVGNNGIMYVSYEDCNISKTLSGIIKATNGINYENIYQYDEYFPTTYIVVNRSKAILCNIFEKKTEGTEYLTQVSIYAPETYTCKVYVNPNGEGKTKEELQQVTLKAGAVETFNVGYHTLEFENPIQITGEKFVVAIEIEGTKKDSLSISLESNVKELPIFNSVEVQQEKCFGILGDDITSANWNDLGKLSQASIGNNLPDGDSTIKAFTTSNPNVVTLRNIQIVTPPDKTQYIIGENFEKEGMKVQANYDNGSSTILHDTDYNIINGTNLVEGQSSVEITYGGKTTTQPIIVVKNTVENLTIETQPTKTEYLEGESFDPTGMVVKATYKDGSTKIVSQTDYTIENGNNLTANQTQVTISYEGKSVVQNITVIPNPLLEINITKAPNKVNYIIGQNFDKTGMVVTGTYENGNKYEILNYTIENGTNLTKEQTSVTIKYQEKTVVQAITVSEKEITEILVDTKPTKLTYIKEKENLDLAGGTLKVMYNDETSETIPMTADGVTVSGFSNETIGTITITVTYQNKTTQFEVEIIEEQKPENSNLSSVTSDVKKVKAYYYTNNSKKDYVLIDVEIDNVSLNKTNDKVEYYYYLSPNANEEEISNWVKITEAQNATDKLQFTIDSREISNYSQISDEGVVYLYIKEVAIKGGDQSVAISKSIKLETDLEVETYVDDVKKNDFNNNKDDTTAPGTIPDTGMNITIIISSLVFIAILCVVIYIKYNKVKDVK